jgi:methylmalonyl-CoA mutase N-terminal domain/subunit
MGLDSDAPLAAGEVGKVGVPLDTVDDLLVLLDGLPLDRVRQMRTSANAIGPIFAAFILVALDELGVDPRGFRLMLQNDPLKEFSARGTFVFPPIASLRLAVDVIEHFAAHMPSWEPIEFCGYHIRDAGGTAVQEVAVATANGIAYLDEAARRGVDFESVTHALYLFLSAGVDIFEEAGKLRASRRIWARLLHERYGVPEHAAAINVFAYTLGGALVAQEPMNNVVRVVCETLAAVLGGIQTLATSSYDEALGLPTQEAAHLALRTQQIVAHESGATTVVDPLGGSYYVEDLTDRLEAEILELVDDIAERGGAVETLERGYIQTMLADSAYRLQREIEDGDRPVVGVNLYRTEAGAFTRSFTVRPELEQQQVADLCAVKARRDEAAVGRALTAVTEAAERGENSIPSLLEAARVRATLGELTSALARVHGRYSASAIRLEPSR